MNLTPWNLVGNFKKVTESEYEYFLNDCIRVYKRVGHGKGINIEDRNNETVAYHNDYKHPNEFWVLKKYIKGE